MNRPTFLNVDRGPITSNPDLGFEAYGVILSHAGEDGDVVALGHVEPLRMIAAMRKVGRSLGLDDEEIFGDYSDFPDYKLTDNICHTKAVFTCSATDFSDWWCYWNMEAKDSEYAIDVTMWLV